MNDRFDLILSALQGVQSEVQNLNQRIDTFEKGMNQRFDELKDSINCKHIESIKADELILQSLETGQQKLLSRIEDVERGMYRLERMELRQNRMAMKVDELEADIALLRDKLQN
ncbi:hypothetical protein [Aneurinibacillus thermoaerophilus]|uniref:Uncharacterized protein n=1 Tax=Aneurinibacillus thermoaerophilus TaxID=143495 RepID=A0ABX8YBM0_ANETH|nr:hypothetical protein [Aneurinibacillus thermoaerophilus]MED0678763.1 hypothetical protein [Aneurinibacillus thermoaerophilus]MED0736752.1 hypothetical protein [Aneurinibacillus thermoaerophilus]MED0766094.1 hypothetical protein [Aneurinibacillus thermoaerophilus]QYY43064.1 hypothetical protein K3F53_01750 [Aneurinibacillus thermoaerophilus]